jgi:hypothetical protein
MMCFLSSWDLVFLSCVKSVTCNRHSDDDGLLQELDLKEVINIPPFHFSPVPFHLHLLTYSVEL